MTAITQSGLDALVARRRPGHSLEAAFYTSQDVFDLDMRLIFGRHWIFVASEPELPEPGDYVTVQLGGTSVILVRDDDMAVRAFHNVCRHRGAVIVRDGKGFVGNLVMGLVFGWWFTRTRRVTPLVVAHTVLDAASFIGYVYLAGRVSWL